MKDNIPDKYVVCVVKDNPIIGHLLPKCLNGKFAKTIFFILRGHKHSTCSVTIMGDAVNLGNGE